MSKAPPTSLSPLPTELLQQLGPLSALQLAWLSGYCWSRCEQAGQQPPASLDAVAAPAASAAAARRITVLSASQTGNARRVAEQLHKQLSAAGLPARLVGAADFKSKRLVEEDIVLLIISTQGEGEVPEEAVPLHRYLFNRKAPQLQQLSFAVLGLGDSSYPQFCQAGKALDAQLEKLGATRLFERGDCDLDYQASANAWIEAAVPRLLALCQAVATSQPSPAGHTPGASLAAAAEHLAPLSSIDSPASQHYTREQPFHATLSARQRITASSAGKDVEHIEIDLGNSGIRYQPGDALGVWPVNDPDLVDEILTLHQLDGSENVRLPHGREVELRHALAEHADITQNTPALAEQYARLSGNESLSAILADSAQRDALLASTPPVGLFALHPHPLPAQQLLDLFRPQSPRLYSIASAQDEVGDEVHLTVGLISFEHHGQHYTGAASGLLGQRISEGETLKVFVEPNPHFRLPEDGNTPVIMIGAGTGIAPFRAFMQQREANGDQGRNWLFFGNQRFTDDFLYQTEWLQYRKSGLLSRGDFAWSRQGTRKVYVQQRLLEAGAEIWSWLQDGAHLYVCGDASRMARDVEQALLQIIREHGQRDADDTEDYLNELRESRRYQRDVY